MVRLVLDSRVGHFPSRENTYFLGLLGTTMQEATTHEHLHQQDSYQHVQE